MLPPHPAACATLMTSPSSNDSFRDVLSPATMADEFVSLFPEVEAHRESLVELARVAWQGEDWVSFYQDIASFLRRVPWLVDRWVGQAAIDAIETTSSFIFAERVRTVSKVSAPTRSRERTAFTQMEGVLLLLKLEAPEEVATHAQLAALLDLVQDGLVSDVYGTKSRAKRRHPLKSLFIDIGRPQTSEALAARLLGLVDKAWGLYPEVSDFLRSTCLPLVCKQPWTWAASKDDPPSLLGADRDPEGGEAPPAPSSSFELPKPALIKFTAEHLASELAVVLRSEEHSLLIRQLSKLWSGERSWDFVPAVHRLCVNLGWLGPIVNQDVNLRALGKVNQALKRKRLNYAYENVRRWRERHSLEPQKTNPPTAITGCGTGQANGLDHLRGLLVLGRLRGERTAFLKADDTLAGAIAAAAPGELVQVGYELQRRPLPLEVVLSGIDDPATPAEFATELRSCVPELLDVDPTVGDVIREHYLPLLDQVSDGTWALEAKNTEGPGKKTLLPPTRTVAEDGAAALSGKSNLSMAQAAGRPPTPLGPPDRLDTVPNVTTPRVRTDRVTKVARTSVRLPTREHPLEGEPPTEAQPEQSFFRKVGASNKPLSLKDEIQWVRRRIWGSNPLLLRNHIEAASKPEVSLALALINERISGALACGHVADARIGIVTALVLATGQAPEVLALADTRIDEGAITSRPRLLLKGGALLLPVLRPESAFNAEGSTGRKLLEPTSGTFTLSLPPTLCRWIDTLLALDASIWRWEAEDLAEAVSNYVGDLEGQINTGLSLSRLRKAGQASIQESTGDLSKTMLLCGSSLGRAETSLFYYNARSVDLEEAFRKAVWPLFGDRDTGGTGMAGSRERVGSQLLVTHPAVKRLARAPSAPMNAPSRGRQIKAAVIEHNILTTHVLCMLLGVGGHRPTAALLGLTRFDFEPELCAAIFQDKKSDPAHFVRYAPVADLVAEQVECYVRHLRALEDLLGPGAREAHRVRAALHGEAALFFALDPSGAPMELELDKWRHTLPEIWKLLPLNWGRTWLASRGREAGIEADHLAIALGHLESVGYPYSNESPMEPAQLSKHLAAPLGSLARQSGWVVRKGLGAKPDLERSIFEAGCLRDWNVERTALAARVREYQVERRQVLRAQMRAVKEQGERIAWEELRALFKREIPTIGELAKTGSTSRAPQPCVAVEDSSVDMTPADLDLVQAQIRLASGSDRILEVAASNALSRYLRLAQKNLKWRCQVPSPWLAPQSMEPTPFFSGMFRATLQVRVLRQAFGSIPPEPPTDSNITAAEWAFGVAALALCLFSFEADPSHVRAILDGRGSATPSGSISDLLLVETKTRIGAKGLRGLSALAVARLNKRHALEAQPEPARLDQVLALMVPSTLAGQTEGLLERICATVAVSNLVELSGLARQANNPKSGCVSMPIERQRQFLEEGRGVPEEPSTFSRLDESELLSRPTLAPSVVKRQYNALRKTLFIGDGPKQFPLTGASLSQASIGAFRAPLRRELTAFVAQSDLSAMVFCLASYALHLTTNGTPGEREPAWSTVYRYITSFGADLVELGAKFAFDGLSPEDILALYQDVIDRKTSEKVKVLVARELAYFQAYLEEEMNYDPVDLSSLEGPFVLPQNRVDAEVVQPQEALAALRYLADRADSSRFWGDPDEVRRDRQAEVYALLVMATGCRHNEIAGLRFKDLLARPEAMVVLARPSRYRRLKTQAARRLVDCTRRLSRRQRRTVSDWVEAEKSRLAKSWKPTLPIFADLAATGTRTPQASLRDSVLAALRAPIGLRSKVHRLRHLVATEDLAELWLSDSDWDENRRARAQVRRFYRPRKQLDVVLPTHLRQKSMALGHRNSATTVLNYFHMPWMSCSRAHASLRQYGDRHAAAAALGVKTSAVDKTLQRGKRERLARRTDKTSILLRSLISVPKLTSGLSHSGSSSIEAGSPAALGARLVERVLRAFQERATPDQIALTYGLSTRQCNHLVAISTVMQKRTGFAMTPLASSSKGSRATRRFRSTPLDILLLSLMDEGREADIRDLSALSSSYMTWVQRSRREEILWPVHDVDRLEQLLLRVGVHGDRIIRTVADDPGFERLVVLRRPGGRETLNHLIAWSLVVVHVTLRLRELNEADQMPELTF